MILKSPSCSVGTHEKCARYYEHGGEVWRCACSCHESAQAVDAVDPHAASQESGPRAQESSSRSAVRSAAVPLPPSEGFQPHVIHDKLLDCIRVILKDCTSVEVRVDERLDLLYNGYGERECVGFTLNGIAHACHQKNITLPELPTFVAESRSPDGDGQGGTVRREGGEASICGRAGTVECVAGSEPADSQPVPLPREQEKPPTTELERYMPIDADLLPCPFCGGHAVLTDVRQSGHSFAVGCVNEACFRPRTDYYDTKEAVVSLWNRRALPREEPQP